MDEYSSELVSRCKPIFFQGFKAIYDTAVSKSKNKKYVLREFQEALESIPNWNSKIIENEYERFKITTRCHWIDDLIKAAFLSLAKRMVRHRENTKMIDLVIPHSPEFIHKCYINIAREFWKKPKIFFQKVSRDELKENLIEAHDIIASMIIETLRLELPYRDMLKNFLDKTSHDETVDEYETEPNTTFKSDLLLDTPDESKDSSTSTSTDDEVCEVKSTDDEVCEVKSPEDSKELIPVNEDTHSDRDSSLETVVDVCDEIVLPNGIHVDNDEITPLEADEDPSVFKATEIEPLEADEDPSVFKATEIEPLEADEDPSVFKETDSDPLEEDVDPVVFKATESEPLEADEDPSVFKETDSDPLEADVVPAVFNETESKPLEEDVVPVVFKETVSDPLEADVVPSIFKGTESEPLEADDEDTHTIHEKVCLESEEESQAHEDSPIEDTKEAYATTNTKTVEIPSKKKLYKNSEKIKKLLGIDISNNKLESKYTKDQLKKYLLLKSQN